MQIPIAASNCWALSPCWPWSTRPARCPWCSQWWWVFVKWGNEENVLFCAAGFDCSAKDVPPGAHFHTNRVEGIGRWIATLLGCDSPCSKAKTHDNSIPNKWRGIGIEGHRWGRWTRESTIKIIIKLCLINHCFNEWFRMLWCKQFLAKYCFLFSYQDHQFDNGHTIVAH